MLEHPIREFIVNRLKETTSSRTAVRIQVDTRLWQSNALARELADTLWAWSSVAQTYVQTTESYYGLITRCQLELGHMPNTISWTVLANRKMLAWELYRFSTLFLLGAAEIIPTAEVRRFEEMHYIAE